MKKSMLSLFFVSMIVILDQNVVVGVMWKSLGSCPQAISIQSSGGSKLWNNRLGDYDLVRYDSSGNAIYEHSYYKGKFLYKIKEDDSHWMAGDEIGKDFGWIGHADCKSKCPNKCGKKKWQYWKGKTSSKDGVWDFDHSLRVEETEMMQAHPPQTVEGKPMSFPHQSATNELVQNEEICTPKDSDDCLRSASGWRGYSCSNSIKYCDDWSKDVRRCCPESCKNRQPFTESVCNDSNGKGTCNYPNDAQCPEVHVLGVEDAIKECDKLGDGWNVTRTTGHSLVCSKVSYLKNCQKCDAWRLFAWEDGACEKLIKSKCNPNMTKAGKYYCGYEPCRKYGVLQYGGDWGKSKSDANNIEVEYD